MKNSVYIILFFLLACTNGKQKPVFTYVVLSFNKTKDPKEPPLPPIPFYAPLNFLIDSSDNFYYYQLSPNPLACGTGYDYNTPYYIGLQPRDMVLVPPESIYEFVKANVYSVDRDSRVVGISSLKDTIQSNELKMLIDSFSVSNNRTRFYIRKATQEEAIVLGHKQQQIFYHSDNVAWDSTKIKFITAKTDFLPPNSGEN